MTHKEYYQLKEKRFAKWNYTCRHYKTFNYEVLQEFFYEVRPCKDRDTYNDVIIMIDTETSKKKMNSVDYDNHVCAWTMSIRAFNKNIVTLYGHKPTECIEAIEKVHENLPGEYTYFFVHNLAYDWVFLELFFFERFGTPISQLNTKSHYPISIKFINGVILRDSLILAQRSLDKWGDDLDVEHKKACGKWDYDLLRNQDCIFSDDELEYIEHDTLCGVECIDKLRRSLNKKIYQIPYTATGIPREEVRKRGKENKARDNFKRMALTYEQYRIAENCYHGGFTHANRHVLNQILGSKEQPVQCFDFASSYPFVMLSEKYPMERFTPYKNCTLDFILSIKDNYAFMFKLIMNDVEINTYWNPMPALQFSKCEACINPIIDNGRILKADYVEIWLTEVDAEVIAANYKCASHICVEVQMAYKDYLPRWFSDYIFECFHSKTILKGGDAVQYALAKARLNSLYGMCVQKCIKDTIEENYETGEYTNAENDPEELYQQYLDQINTILPYQWGVWVTSYAFRNLFELGKCVDYANGGIWAYSDTDSCYATLWNYDKVNAYNERCKEKLLKNNYGCVYHNNREYWLGVAETEGDKDKYIEFKVQGAKRYCGRCLKDNELHITVAGVPKSGYKCLNDDINMFTKGLIFPGTITGKKTHTYIYVSKIYTDVNGNITGHSIDLSPCDYLLDMVERYDWDYLFSEEVAIQVYE